MKFSKLCTILVVIIVNIIFQISFPLIIVVLCNHSFKLNPKHLSLTSLNFANLHLLNAFVYFYTLVEIDGAMTALVEAYGERIIGVSSVVVQYFRVVEGKFRQARYVCLFILFISVVQIYLFFYLIFLFAYN